MESRLLDGGRDALPRVRQGAASGRAALGTGILPVALEQRASRPLRPRSSAVYAHPLVKQPLCHSSHDCALTVP